VVGLTEQQLRVLCLAVDNFLFNVHPVDLSGLREALPVLLERVVAGRSVVVS
jgi:hypothetical protein